MRLLLLGILLTACGGNPDCLFLPKDDTPRAISPCTVPQLGGWIDESALPFVSMFSDDATARGIPCFHTPVIGFLEEPLPEDKDILGYCMFDFDIVFVREYWKWMTPESRRTLVYHELGHCALHRSHASGNEIDIMNPYLIADSVAVPQWDSLVNKLFTGKE